MLRAEFPDAAEQSSAALLAAYESLLTATIETAGVDAVAAQTGLDRDVIEAIADGEAADVTLADAAAVLAIDPDRPDAGAIEAEARDILLMGMTTAVMDVESLASGIDSELDPKEIQQKIEGRYPVTLAEYARLHQYIESQQQ
ncbi:DUF5791 family protein [Halomicroarcula sp. GCM10025709]|uniref:DUF5791 family protein n=1 Tax=Haloarcula TaxID=2237 RepID=UPI0024C4302D|nr:DUF5791 family protein [Halomicroarcula sp. YJ-61-S]